VIGGGLTHGNNNTAQHEGVTTTANGASGRWCGNNSKQTACSSERQGGERMSSEW